MKRRPAIRFHGMPPVVVSIDDPPSTDGAIVLAEGDDDGVTVSSVEVIEGEPNTWSERRPDALDVLHELAADRFGRGAAIEIREERPGYKAIAWAPNGIDSVASETKINQVRAMADLKKALKS